MATITIAWYLDKDTTYIPSRNSYEDEFSTNSLTVVLNRRGGCGDSCASRIPTQSQLQRGACCRKTIESVPLCTAMAPKKRNPGVGAEQRIIDLGRPECNPPFADNSIKTSRFTLLSFFPLVREAYSVSFTVVTGDLIRAEFRLKPWLHVLLTLSN